MLRVVSVRSLPMCFTVFLFFAPPASAQMPEQRTSQGALSTVTGEAKFQVNGTSWFQGDSTPLPPEAGEGIAVGYAAGYGGGYIAGFDYTTFTPRHLFLNHAGGNVGINTLTPIAKLHVVGDGSNTVIYGSSSSGITVYASSSSNIGVYGQSGSSNGVQGYSNSSNGILGQSGNGYGIYGESTHSFGVYGYSFATNSAGIYGQSPYIGVEGITTNGSDPARQAVRGDNFGSATGYAGYFYGNVAVLGTLSKSAGSFKIDHPLDPQNKYLSHSFVESPDMMNIYNGNTTLDARGEAVVVLPDYFEALNRDVRYQLTPIGGFAPVYIAEEIEGNRFKIAGGAPGMKVSWQVTGIRHDAYADQPRIPVEEMKPPGDRGRYLHPAAFGLPMERAVEASRIRPEPLQAPPVEQQEK